MEFDYLVSRGKNASVYRQGNNVVKLFNKGINKTDVLNEALNTTRVEETGLPIPSISEVSIIDGQWAITMNYIEGKTLADLMDEHPEQQEEYIEQMVDLQLQIHSKRAPLLNKLKDKLNRQINDLEELDEIKKYDLLTRLDGMPKHVKVCHGDFCPSNIIVSHGKMYVLDWVHASQGNASADAAKTFLLLSLYNPDTAELYMERFCKKSNTERRYVDTWLPIVAAAQLTKKKEEERELLLKWLDVVEYE
ncbi:MAG: aminoglycoside phosphotransferase [Lachnospiraceae bacterium]|nr:aminoglycoside phosphotransferase [Lachnospiraceae bacterium]